MKYILPLLLLLALLTTACGSGHSHGGQDGPRAADLYQTEMEYDEAGRKLIFKVTTLATGEPAELKGGKLIHTHILPADLSTLYHEHPDRVAAGQYALDLSFLPAPGEYDVWVEVSHGDDHGGAYLKRFPLVIDFGAGERQQSEWSRVTFAPHELGIAAPGELSHLEFKLQLDGKPVSKYGTYQDVQVHAFAVSLDRTWLMHDHAHTMKGGIVDAHAAFPRGGEYLLFLEPTVKAGKTEIRPMLRYPITVPVD